MTPANGNARFVAEILEQPPAGRQVPAALSRPAVRARGIAWRLRALSGRLKAALVAYNEKLTLEAVRDACEAGRQLAAAELADVIRSTAPQGHGDGCTVPGCLDCGLAAQADRYARFADLIGTPEGGGA